MMRYVRDYRCDLLSFYYLCRTGNNRCIDPKLLWWVVICFHFTIFVVLETTSSSCIITTGLLWFAFILLSLSYWKQPLKESLNIVFVVICFHFTIFVVLETTTPVTREPTAPLWFAFILLSLSYWKQLFVKLIYKNSVVICFHFTIFVVLETTQSVLFVVCQCIIEIAGI